MLKKFNKLFFKGVKLLSIVHLRQENSNQVLNRLVVIVQQILLIIIT